MDAFAHEELEVYQAALELVSLQDRLARGFSPGRSALADQMLQGSIAILREVAAAAGQPPGEDRGRIFHEALNTTLQCAALLDVVKTLRLADEEAIAACRPPLLRITELLQKSVTGTGK